MQKNNLSQKFFLILTFLFFGFLYVHFSTNMLSRRESGLWVGHINLYGDLVFHLTLINKYLESGKFLIENPIFAYGKVNYSVFADFLTAQVSRVSNIYVALIFTTFIAGMLGIISARKLIKVFFKKEQIVFLSLFIFFLNGGLGFIYFFKDFLNSNQNFFEFLLKMPTEYTELKDKDFWWINNFLAYFLPQRPFLFAFPLTLFILYLLYNGATKNLRRNFVIAGLLAGLLPVVQIHSLIFLFMVLFFYSIFDVFGNKRFNKDRAINWTVFGIFSAIIALPLFFLISSVSPASEIIKIRYGWMKNGNIVWFWLKNLGIFAPLLIISLFWLFRKNKKLLIIYLPFLSIFVICNFLKFQPWEFDNGKLLIYWYFASSIVVAAFVYECFLIKSAFHKIVGIILIFLMVFSATLDIFRTFTNISDYQIFSNEDIDIASYIKTNTPKNAVFLTAPVHNHPVPALAGRSVLVGFHGWLWSHGVDYSQRAQDVENIYAGREDALEKINEYKISYISVGPPEVSSFIINYNFLNKFPKVVINEKWQIFKVNNLWSYCDRQNCTGN